MDEIPLRATILSIILLIPATISCPILGILYYVSDDLVVKFYMTFIICNTVAIFRNPVIALATFRANENNKKKNEEKEREKRRLKAIQQAQEARKHKVKDELSVTFMNVTNEVNSFKKYILNSYHKILAFHCRNPVAPSKSHQLCP